MRMLFHPCTDVSHDTFGRAGTAVSAVRARAAGAQFVATQLPASARLQDSSTSTADHEVTPHGLCDLEHMYVDVRASFFRKVCAVALIQANWPELVGTAVLSGRFVLTYNYYLITSF